VIVTVVWAVLGMFVWSGSWFLLASWLAHLVNEGSWRPREILVDLVNYGGLAVMLMIPCVVAVLGMRRKLPGTRSSGGGRGFVVIVPDDGAASNARER